MSDMLDRQVTGKLDDTISRQAAIDALKDWYDGAIVATYGNVKKVIDALPSVQPEQDAISRQATLAYLKGYDDGKDFMLYRHAWLPTAGCLPDSERRVLCLTKTKKGVLNYVIGYYADGMWRCGMNSNVIAWMELPAPPEEEQT